MCHLFEWSMQRMQMLMYWSCYSQLEFLPRGCTPPPTSQVAVHIHVCPDLYDILYAVKTLKEFNKSALSVFFVEMEVITILTCLIPLNHFQWETCHLHLETIFTEECRGLIESFITWCNDSHLKLNISKTNELVVDYQRNRRPPVLVVIQGEEVKRVDSYKHLGVQINK